MPTVDIRWATPHDVALFFGERPTRTIRALVITIDGVPEAIGGTYTQSGYSVAFMDLRPAVRTHKKALIKAMKLAIERLVKTSRFPVVAIAEEDEPTAPGLLKHWGFEQIDEETFIWRS